MSKPVKDNTKLLEFAYKKAFGLTGDEVQLPEHKRKIKEALKTVWSYQGLYPGETEIQREERLDMTGPTRGDWTELARHFKNIYGGEFSDMTSYEIIFTVYSRMKEAGTDSAETSVPESNVDTAPLSSLEEASSLINNLIHKEDSKMDQHEMGGMTADEILNSMESAGAGSISSKPVGKDNLRSTVIQEKLMKEQNDRLAMSRKVIITSVVLNCPPSEQRAVNGKDATGTIVEPAKKLAKFVKTFGVVEDEATGDIKMNEDMIPESELDKAKKVYTVLKQASEDPTIALAAKTTNKRGTPRALGFDGIEDTTKFMDKKEAKTFVYNKTVGEIHSNTEMFVQLAAARQDKASNNREARTESAPKAVTVLQFCNYGSLQDDVVPADFFKLAQICDTEAKHEFDPKFRAEDYSFKYYSAKNSSQDATKKRLVTYPLTLSVETYALKDNPDAAVAAFKGKAAGGPKVPTDFTNTAAVETKFAELSKFIAKQIATDASELGDFADMINEAMDVAEQATQQSQMAMTE